MTEPTHSSEPHPGADQRFGPLHGVRVLEFSQIVAGPVAGLNLADLGAEVIKVEPPAGDPHRFVSTTVPGESKMYQGNNRGKKSLVVNLHHPDGLALIHRLVPAVDVVVSNFRLGVAGRLGIDYATLKRLRPDSVYAQISGFGEHGPDATRGGADIVAQAHSGLMAMDGKYDADGVPEMIGVPVADYSAGFALAMAVCAALFHRERTGEGQYVSTSLLRVGLFVQNRYVMREPVSDVAIRDPMMARVAEARARGAPFSELVRLSGRRLPATPAALYYRAYQARDGVVVLGALTPQNRHAVRRVLGIEGQEHSDSPDFDASDPESIWAIERWKVWMAERMRTATVDEWLALFDAAGAPAARLNFPEEMADDPQANADGMISEMEHRVTGPQRVVGPAVTMSATPTGTELPSPALGEHTVEILHALGIEDSEVDRLLDAGAVRVMD